LSKNFASTVSPWIVTMDALQPFRAPFERPAGDPAPLPYLDAPELRERGMVDITLDVELQTAAMRAVGQPPRRLTRANARDAYWAFAQLVAHHTVNGCNLAPGDLLGTGTISGPQADQGGSLLELTHGGQQPLRLHPREERTLPEGRGIALVRAH